MKICGVLLSCITRFLCAIETNGGQVLSLAEQPQFVSSLRANNSGSAGQNGVRSGVEEKSWLNKMTKKTVISTE